MPKISKIAPGQRRNWLELSESGESTEKIAKDAGRDVRTVREHIQKARLERDFEAAQRDQLREALQGHQRDMLALLEHLRRAVQVPPLTFRDVVGLDFGLEDLWDSSDLARNREVSLNGSGEEAAAAVKVIRDDSGPVEIILTIEGSRLWRAIKEHVGKDPLWRHMADWRNGLLQELQSRAALNRAVREKLEGIFGLRVGWRPLPPEPWLAPGVVWWMRARLTCLALGDYVPDLEEDIRQASPGGLESRDGQWLADRLEDTEQAMGHLRETLAAMTRREEVKAAARSFASLQNRTSRVHDALDEYLLIHHIPGRCGLCRKLGGQ